MEKALEHPGDEIKRLQRCNNDLLSILTLPAMWTGAEPFQIVHTFLDALLAMLQLDLLFVRLKVPIGDAPIEMLRVAHSRTQASRRQEIIDHLNKWVGADPQDWRSVMPSPFDGAMLSIVALPLGLHGEIGVFVAGSARVDFPRQTEKLLLGVAVNQAAVGLQAAQLLSEQKRVASELDQTVTQRTAELAAASSDLNRQVVDRRLTEEKLRREERELRHSQARNAAILSSALDCIVTIDHNGCITEFNPAAERTFGYRRDEVVGKQLADVIIPASLRERHRQGLARDLATGQTQVIGTRIEMTAIRRDGSEFPVELAITRIPVDGRPSFTGYLRDITERKRSEEELRRSEAYLAEAQRLSLTGSFGWNVHADKHFWSHETFRIFDYDASTRVTLQLILERIHPQDIPLVKHAIAEAADGKELDYECRLLMPDNSVKHLHIVGHGILGHDGSLEYIGAVQDVTQRRLSEEALTKVRSELAHMARVTTLGALTASIAHEVNQPLSGIITNANTCMRMLSADPPNITGAIETARRTIRDGNRASNVIARLRALFSKNKTMIESVDLNEATREVIALCLRELQRSRVILQTELSDDLPPVSGDRVQLQQVILNLLLNASDAMSGIDDRPRQLIIKTEANGQHGIRLAVQDAGVGIEPQSLDKLFEAFYTTKNGGMGIGLSVSRSIIESHHGRLWATPNEGPGATFSFSIPRESEGANAARGPDTIRTPAASATEHVPRNP